MYNGTGPLTDGINAGVEERKQRGFEIAALARIECEDGIYVVPSVTAVRPTKYKVNMSGLRPRCTCPDHEIRGCKCKHIYAVECVIKRETLVAVEPNGTTTTTVTESVSITKTRKTYPQDWPAYNEAQVNEKRQFQALLHDLCKGIPALPVAGRKGAQGRKPIPVAQAIFCAVFKVYSTVSARRFTSDLCDAQAKGYIERVPHFNSVLNYLEHPEMFPILTSLIERASLPLSAIESKFAVDSTGFTTCRFVRWFDVKYNRFTHEQQWVKAHICTGVKTNVVTAIEIHGRNAGDATQLPALVETTAKSFTMKEVSADKGYSSRECHDAIDRAGATPFIAFKANATGNVGGLFGKMFHYFNYRAEEFMLHYHQRSNVESTVMMIKSKFGDSLRSKSEVAQKNETLCKVLCHNICCLISAMYELGVQPMLLGSEMRGEC
jgi:transposase